MKLSNLFGHIKTVMIHKHYVYRCMKDCGYGFRGLFHDMSKFSPTEFFESVKYYDGHVSPINKAKEDKGYSDAWFHHRGRNKHHSQYWVDISFGEIIPCKMPYKYLVEHICDTIGAGKAYMKDEWTKSAPIDYWDKVDNKSFYHNDTRAVIEYVYLLIYLNGWESTSKLFKNGIIEEMYEKVSYNNIREEIYNIRMFQMRRKSHERRML